MITAPNAIPGAIPDIYPLEVDEGVVLYYDMQDMGRVIRDHSGRGNNCTLVGDPVSQVGPAGYTRYFDGSDDYGTFPQPVTSTNVTDITTEFWVKPVSTGQAHALMLCGASNPATISIQITNTGVPRAAKGIFQKLLSTATLTFGVWAHVVFTLSGGSVHTFYVDGVAAGTATAANTYTNGTPWALGSLSNSSASTPLTGNLGIVRVYNKALTAVEVLANYRRDAWRCGLRG